MILLMVMIAVVLIAAGFWYFGRKPAIHRNLTEENLRELLEVLLNQGYDGGVLFIQGRNPLPFLQVMKYTDSRRLGLQLDFPAAHWSTPYLPKVRSLMQSVGMPRLNESATRHDELGFLSMDFGVDVQAAAKCVKQIAEDGLGLQLDIDGRAYFEGVSSNPRA